VAVCYTRTDGALDYTTQPDTVVPMQGGEAQLGQPSYCSASTFDWGRSWTERRVGLRLVSINGLAGLPLVQTVIVPKINEIKYDDLPHLAVSKLPLAIAEADQQLVKVDADLLGAETDERRELRNALLLALGAGLGGLAVCSALAVLAFRRFHSRTLGVLLTVATALAMLASSLWSYRVLHPRRDPNEPMSESEYLRAESIATGASLAKARQRMATATTGESHRNLNIPRLKPSN
jgi:hypothetical protein